MKKNIVKKQNIWLLLVVIGLVTVAAAVSALSASTGANNIAGLSPDGTVFSIRWGDLGMRMVEAGVIDFEKFVSVYDGRGGLSDEDAALLRNGGNALLEINDRNAHVALNLLWAFGLSNANPILEDGSMRDPRYGGADRFASTGGWTLARGTVMDHYGTHSFITLTDEQQRLVEEVSKNIYRPCCNNATHFPDCNHGMAMLGLLQLLATQGASEADMYETALVVNSYWFSSVYKTLGTYFAQREVPIDLSAKEILGAEFSSAAGYRNVLAQVQSVGSESTSCGV